MDEEDCFFMYVLRDVKCNSLYVEEIGGRGSLGVSKFSFDEAKLMLTLGIKIKDLGMDTQGMFRIFYESVYNRLLRTRCFTPEMLGKGLYGKLPRKYYLG